jgi:GR25 family glycosyltransferase involved in LPS biosynthesis
MNLEKNKNRNENMIKMLDYLQLKYSRFNAVNGLELKSNRNYLKQFDESKYLKFNFSSQNFNSKISYGTVGYWLSDLLLFKKISLLKTNYATVIFEDDIDIEENFTESVNNALANAPSDWDLILCGYCWL